MAHDNEPVGFNERFLDLWEASSRYIAFLAAGTATVGSLLFSQAIHLIPCELCWYQRIAMYPLVVVLACGIIMRDQRVRYYALPVCLGGLIISIYHNLLYYGIIPESITPCTKGISCTTRQIEWLGFITIPLMALAAFVGIATCLLFSNPDKEGE